MRRHAAYLVAFFGDEGRGCRDIRKHIAWYLKGFPAGGALRSSRALVDPLPPLDRVGHHLHLTAPAPRRSPALADSLAALHRVLDTLDLTAPWPGDPPEGPRGRAGSPRRLVLPD